MDPRNPGDKKDDDVKKAIADNAGALAKGIGLAGVAAKATGDVLPPAVKYAGKAAGIVAEAAKDPSPNWGENLVCGAAATVVVGAIVGPPVVAAGAAGAAAAGGAAAPTVFGIIPGAAAGAMLAGGAVGGIVAKAAEPVGQNVKGACHAAFGWFKGRDPSSTAKDQQARQCQKQMVDSRLSYSAANLHTQRQTYQYVISHAPCFNAPFQIRQHSPLFVSATQINRWVWQAQDRVLWDLRMRYGYVPTWLENQVRSQISSSSMTLLSSSISGYNSSLLAAAEFSLTLMSTSLINSYNIYHLESSIYSPWGLYGDIGGVASEVATIKDIIDSEAHATADAYHLCFPAKHLPFSDSLFNQVKNELEHAFKHKALPFFSLHFNQSGFLYPVLHPAYQNTLIGEIIGLLDYFLKCYLNGGMFDPEFLKKWHETANCDEAFLKSKIIDLKKYCKQYAPSVRYLSLRELESRFGVKDKSTKSSYQQPFMTSFRIIAYQQKIERQDNILIPHPDFKIEYSIDLMPDYRQYVDNYMKEHGQLPPEYMQIRQCYELFCNEIKEKMPKLPLCKDFFNLLGVINSLCYVYTTLDKMGKQPVVEPLTGTEQTVFPKALPPIPVRYHQSFDVAITLQDVVTALTNTPQKIAALNQLLSRAFTAQSDVPEELVKQIEGVVRTALTAQLQAKLPPQELAELNDEDITRITAKVTQQVWGIAHSFAALIENEIDDLFYEQNELIELPISERLPLLTPLLNQQITGLKATWQATNLTTPKDDLVKLSLKTIKLMAIAIPQYEHAITALKKNKAEELAKLTPQQKAANQANVTRFEQDMDRRVAEVEAKVRQLNELEQLSQGTAIQYTLAHQATVVEALAIANEVGLEVLNQFSTIPSNLTSKFSTLSSNLKSKTIAKTYTHSFIGFTGKALSEKTGDRFQIVGGCGMELPNLSSHPIPHADSFCTAVKSALATTKERKALFEHNHTQYVVYSLPVRDVEYTVEQEKENKSIHESAAIAKPEEFQQLLAHAPGQLSLADSHGNLPIHSAAQSGNTDAIATMLDHQPALIEAQNNRGMTPLMLAVQFGQQKIVELLHARKANFNHILANGLFPLYMAIQRNFASLAIWMVSNVDNLDVNKELDSKMTALHLATQSGATELAKCLIRRGATHTVRRKSDGFTALHCAAQLGDTELLDLLVNNTNANQALESKKTPLHLAAEAGHLQAVQLLIARGASPDAQTLDGDTPLILAIKAGQTEVALYLAEKSAINVMNGQQQTASLLALLYSQPAVGDVLIRRGENSSSLDKTGANYTYYLVRNGEYHRVKELLTSRPAAQQLLINGNSLLAIAAQHGHFLLVDLFQGLNISYQSTSRLTVLDYAVMADEIGYLRDNYDSSSERVTNLIEVAIKNGSIHCLQFLLHKLSAASCQDPAFLCSAIASNNESIMNIILKYCLDLNKPLDSEGNTAIHIAVKYGAHHAFTLLAQRGCQFNKMNSHNQTAFHLAVAQNDADLLKRLFKLCPPIDWPRDLWALANIATGSDILKVLQKFAKQIHAEKLSLSLVSDDPVIHSTTLPPCPLLTEPQKALLDTLKRNIDQGQFEKVLNMLKRHSILLDLFKTTKGASLFQHIFKAIADLEDVTLEGKQKQVQTRLTTAIDRLLIALKSNGVNPGYFMGKQNVLLAIMAADSDKEACYRLKVFARHFAEAIPVLAQDKSLDKTSMSQLALSRNQPGLFELLESHCKNGLHEAIRANQYDLVVRLLQRYPVNGANEKGVTPLMLAAAQGNLAIVNLLLQNGAMVDQLDHQSQTAVRYALSRPSLAVALTLLPLLKKPNQPNRFGVTAGMLAAAKGLVPVLRFLCESGHETTQSVDKDGHNAMHHAAITGQADSISYLVTQGYSPDQPESPPDPKKLAKSRKRTPLHLAALKGHEEAVMRMLGLNANPDKEDANGNNLSEYAVIGKKKEILDIVRLLPSYNDKARNRHLLHAAALSDNVDVLSELILDGANLNALDDTGRSALHIACIYNSGRVAQLLLSGEDVVLDSYDKHGYAPIHYAAEFGHVRLIELLAKAKVDLNQLNGNKDCALTLADAKGQTGSLIALLKHNADFSIAPQQLQHKLTLALKKHGLYQLKQQTVQSVSTPQLQATI